jgi:hypothetical protein
MKTVLKKLLADVERYRVIRRDLFCQHLSDSQIKTLDRQLRYSRSIQTFHHACGLSLMLPRRRAIPSESSLASHVARYTFLHQETEHRRLLTKDELQTWFPALFRPGLPHGYFVDHSERRPSLGLLQVDTHLRDPRRIQAEFSEQIRKALYCFRFPTTNRTSPVPIGHACCIKCEGQCDQCSAAQFRMSQRALRGRGVADFVRHAVWKIDSKNTPRRCGFVKGSRPRSGEKQWAGRISFGRQSSLSGCVPTGTSMGLVQRRRR